MAEAEDRIASLEDMVNQQENTLSKQQSIIQSMEARLEDQEDRSRRLCLCGEYLQGGLKYSLKVIVCMDLYIILLWKGRWQGNDIVIKVLKIRDWTTRKSRDFNEEYPKLRIFSHPNVLPVLGACQSPPAPHPVLITHWMPYGSLYNVLHEGTSLVVDQCQAVKFGLDIARGMAFLHTLEPLIPRHYLNSRSVMIDEDMTARISMADVKLSFQCAGRIYCPAWVAPEALQKRPEDINRRSADMWSFAILLWELVTREVPFADLSNMEIGMKVGYFLSIKQSWLMFVHYKK
ncbi:integrin-linked protein kinase [Bombina bombina]|uniref:integrin-linked protein kinase n=1 Tax=Bombina bombina TaxID=8345 RepID=UPI00235AF9EA|nr:integrin-linked protein kinase [Bombina bombina]